MTEQKKLEWAYFSEINQEKLALLQNALNSEILSTKAHESEQHANQVRALADAKTCILDAFRALEQALQIIENAVKPPSKSVIEEEAPW